MNQERLTGIAVVLLGVFVYAVLIPLGIDRPDQIEQAVLAPDFWPKIIAVMIALLGVLLVLIKPTADSAVDSDVDSEQNALPWWRLLPGLIFVLGSLFAFYFLIPLLGMVVPGMVLLAGLMIFAGERRWLLILLLAVGVPLALYAFFVFIASTPIPLGVFENLRG